MEDTQKRLDAAKKKAETLKSDIEKSLADKSDCDISQAALQKGSDLKGIGNPLKLRRVLKGHFGKVYAMDWSGDSINLVSASQDGKLIVWNGLTTNKVQAIHLRSSWVMTCAFEKTNNQLVAYGGLDNLCSIHKLGQPQGMRETQELVAHDGYISCCRFIGPDTIITSSGDKTCISWDVEMGVSKQQFTEHTGDVMSVSVLPSVDPNIFVSGSCDTLAKVWDMRHGKCVQTLKGHESDINSVKFFPDGRAVGTGSDDSSCCLFDLRCYGEVNYFGNDKILCGITSVDFSRSGRLLFAGYDDYNCYVWDTTSRSTLAAYQLAGHENRISCLGVNPKGDALCTGSWDTLLKPYNQVSTNTPPPLTPAHPLHLAGEYAATTPVRSSTPPSQPNHRELIQ